MSWVIEASRFLVSLKPLGIDFKKETTAKSADAAVGHVLYYYLGKDRMRLQERLFRFRQEFGEDGWQKKVEEMASEIEGEWAAGEEPKPPYIPEGVPPPEPDDQLRLFEFQKTSDKTHPGAQIADQWKKTHIMKFVGIDKLREIVGDEEVTISAKLDGELVCLYYKDGQLTTVTPKGTVRVSMPATDEAAQILKQFREAAFLAEMYAVDEKGRPMSYVKSATILKSPDDGKDGQIRLSVFDIVAINGQLYDAETVEDNAKEIEDIFSKGKYVHAAPTVVGNFETIDTVWSELEEKGWEGLVVYLGDTIYKTKPILSFDMVIVAVSKSDKILDRVSAILTSFIDKEGNFRLSGEIGGGLNEADRAELMNWAERNKVMEDEDHIWVDPFKEPLIVQVEAVEVNHKKMPKMKFEDGAWIKIEDDWAGTLRFPQFVQYRDDKDPKHPDVRVEQLPVQSSLQQTLRVGASIKVVTGQTGKIIELVPRDNDSNFDIIVQWTPPLFGALNITEVHSSEIVSVWN